MSGIYDVAVVGSGYAGSLFAMIARRLGKSVVLLERGSHPRVVIGESSTPLSNLLMEELAGRYDLPKLQPLTKWGSWRRTYPEVACGLKRGFTFLGDETRGERLMVAASPHDEIADTHWFRADTDAFLVEEAMRCGVEYADRVELRTFADDGDAVRLVGKRDGEAVEFRARFAVDATGPRGFLHGALGLAEAELPGYPETSGLWSHFTGVKRLERVRDWGECAGYLPNDAAVHHVFDGGWVWVLQFCNGWTSAGVAATAECAERLRLGEGEAAWERVLARVPVLREQFAEARAEMPFTHAPHMAFRSAAMAGERWAMLPSAAGFVDPLLSTGFPLTLLGVERLAGVMERSWGTAAFADELQAYAAKTDGELLATARLIGGLYGSMGRFEVFRALTLLYFAAASFSETARRLGRPELAGSFLLHEDPVFGPAMRRVLELAGARAGAAEVGRAVQEAIAPFDVAGLGREGREWCYPVMAEDLLESAWKVGATPAEAMGMMERADFLRRSRLSCLSCGVGVSG